MDEPPRKLNPLERFRLAWLDPDPDYAAWWRKYELEARNQPLRRSLTSAG